MGPLPIAIPPRDIEAFCRKWRVKELSVFGSILRDEFGPASDVDVLVDLLPDHGLGLYEWVDMRDEPRQIFGRDVDLVAKEGLRNPFRRQQILRTARVLYAS